LTVEWIEEGEYLHFKEVADIYGGFQAQLFCKKNEGQVSPKNGAENEALEELQSALTASDKIKFLEAMHKLEKLGSSLKYIIRAIKDELKRKGLTVSEEK
ncbi:unnamed protein product, partial [marine sediment metagenome]